MKLELKGKRRKCRDCEPKDLIYSFQPRFKAREGYYCEYHGKIKRLHDGVMKFINKIK